jgi:hypothetical protein
MPLSQKSVFGRPSSADIQHNAEHCDAECHLWCVAYKPFMLNVVVLGVVVPSSQPNLIFVGKARNIHYRAATKRCSTLLQTLD